MRDHLRDAKLLRQKISYACAREEARKLKITTRRYLRLRAQVLADIREKQEDATNDARDTVVQFAVKTDSVSMEKHNG